MGSRRRIQAKAQFKQEESISPGGIVRPAESGRITTDRPAARLARVAREIPWSIGSVAVILLVAFAAGSLEHLPADALINRWGVGVQALIDGKLWTIVTSNFLIDHPVAIISTVVLAIVATGVCELMYGTWRAAFAWFMGTWAPLALAVVLLIPTHLLNAQGATDRLMISEVGSSTATWCCAGAIVGFPWLVRDWRRLVGLATIALLVAILVVRPDFTSVEHFTAVFTGMALQRAWRSRPSRLNVVTRDSAARLMAIICGVVFLVEVVLTGVTASSAALLPIGVALILVSFLVGRSVDLTLAVLVGAGGVLANLLEPNAATILAVGAALWLLLYRGRWTLPETAADISRGEALSRLP